MDIDHLKCVGSPHCTPLMGVAVGAILPPRQQAVLRSAGRVGGRIYQEVVEQLIPAEWLEMDTSTINIGNGNFEDDRSKTYNCVPCTLPLQSDVGGTLVLRPKEVMGVATVGGLPHGPITKIRHVGVESVKEVKGKYVLEFLEHPSNPMRIRSVQLAGFGNVVTIQHCLLQAHAAITTIDLSPFRNVTSIGNMFMEGCVALTDIDFTPMGRVTCIGNNFMARCTSIATINISSWNSMKKIGCAFLEGCGSITAIDLSSLTLVVEVGGQFMMGCTSIKSIDLSPLGGTIGISDMCMQGCTSLQSIDISPLHSIPPKIGVSFAVGCASFTTGRDLTNVTGIGRGFLRQCSSLPTVDLSHLINVATIGDCFMENCESVTSIDITNFTNLTKVGSAFMKGCKALVAIDLSSLRNVTKIEDSFMWRCRSLTSIDLTPFSSVTEIGSCFLADCSSLTSIDLHPLRSVTKIGDLFISQCTSLAEVDVAPLTNVRQLRGFFLFGTAMKVPSDAEIATLSSAIVSSLRDRQSKSISPGISIPPSGRLTNEKGVTESCRLFE